MCELLLDTDVLIKLAAYNLLPVIDHPGCASGCMERNGLIAASRYVALNQLGKKASDPAGATARLNDYCSAVALLEPTSVELQLAAGFEDAAARAGVDLDIGESQLCAIALSRGCPVVLTGDKRAIKAAEALLAAQPALAGLSMRLACLEQAMIRATERLGPLAVRDLVLTERRMDIAVDICFQVTNPAPSADFWPTGLLSYIHDLRASAPTMLIPSDTLSL
ncbi:MAG: hypothetical protein IPL41_09715 [Micropruina sp.]|nr:hypothetical protein [Micropruina sp.]